MSKPARGTKRVCPSCEARYYDLGRSPITCPVCQAAYPITPPSSSRRSERVAPAEPPKPEVQIADPPATDGVEVISLDEVEEAEEAVAKEIVDIVGEDDEDIPAADDDDTFLEEEEEGDAAVAAIVPGGAKEET